MRIILELLLVAVVAGVAYQTGHLKDLDSIGMAVLTYAAIRLVIWAVTSPGRYTRGARGCDLRADPWIDEHGVCHVPKKDPGKW